MEDRILKFILALRSQGVRISLAESADAFKSIQELGVKDRELFRISLQSTLVKDVDNIPTFNELFPQYFGGLGVSGLRGLSEDLTDEEAAVIAQALRDYAEQIRRSLERLMDGDSLTQEELDRTGRRVGLPGMDDLRYQEWMARRMQAALKFDEVQQALQELLEALAQMGMADARIEEIGELVGANLDRWSEQIRRFAGESIAEQAGGTFRQDPLNDLYYRPFRSLSEAEMRILRHEVRRLAARLKTRIALRQKRSKSGILDAKATIRANLKHQNVPMVVKHRDRKLQPRLVVICDISTSMRHLSELMLSLIYSLQDLIRKTHAFAFIDHLEYISPTFERRASAIAVDRVLQRLPSGYYNTDLGRSLDGFVKNYLDTLNRQTSLILLGDGRNNYNNPRIDLFRMMTRRANRTIWINPEQEQLWGTGDSDMLEYAPHCDDILRVNNLAELSGAVDSLLT
ncbi:MAG: VWA domain-containing protein [Anaerolineales bacterium]|nr:VWA domain-containing protein [Anaerolineales bacterium]